MAEKLKEKKKGGDKFQSALMILSSTYINHKLRESARDAAQKRADTLKRLDTDQKIKLYKSTKRSNMVDKHGRLISQYQLDNMSEQEIISRGIMRNDEYQAVKGLEFNEKYGDRVRFQDTKTQLINYFLSELPKSKTAITGSKAGTGSRSKTNDEVFRDTVKNMFPGRGFEEMGISEIMGSKDLTNREKKALDDAYNTNVTQDKSKVKPGTKGGITQYTEGLYSVNNAAKAIGIISTAKNWEQLSAIKDEVAPKVSENTLGKQSTTIDTDKLSKYELDTATVEAIGKTIKEGEVAQTEYNNNKPLYEVDGDTGEFGDRGSIAPKDQESVFDRLFAPDRHKTGDHSYKEPLDPMLDAATHQRDPEYDNAGEKAGAGEGQSFSTGDKISTALGLGKAIYDKYA